MTGRNEPCPCGSGRKYKQCCAKAEIAQERSQREMLRDAATSERAWAVDAVPLMIGIEDRSAKRPVALLVTAGDLILKHELLGRLGGEASDVAKALESAVVDAARETGVYPQVLRVRHAEVADALVPLMQPRDVVVETDEMPQLANAALGAMQHLAGHSHWPPVCHAELWNAWELPRALVGDVFAAAAAFYRSAPWDDASNLQAPRAELPSGRVWTCSMLGNAGEVFGLALYSDPWDLFERTMLVEPTDGFKGLRGRLISLTFDSPVAGHDALREARVHHWEVAGPSAYPELMTVNTPGGGVSRADIEDLIALLRAFPSFVQAHRDALLREERTGNPVKPIVWTDPDSGVVFRYAGEASAYESSALEFDDDADDIDFGDEALYDFSDAETDGDPDRDVAMFDDVGSHMQAALLAAMSELGPNPDRDAFQEALSRQLQNRMGDYNCVPQPHLGGLSPVQVRELLNSDWLKRDGAVRFRDDLPANDVAHTDWIINARALLGLAQERDGALGATQAGNLKLEVVKEMLGRLKLDEVMVGYFGAAKRITEQDVFPLQMLRVTCEFAGLLEPASNRFELTDTGRALLDPARAGSLYHLLFCTVFQKLNLSYGRPLQWSELQYQAAYTLYRLRTVAKKWRAPQDLLEDVVLPFALEQGPQNHETASVIFAVRILDPLAAFGLLERKRAGKDTSPLKYRYRMAPLAGKFLAFAL